MGLNPGLRLDFSERPDGFPCYRIHHVGQSGVDGGESANDTFPAGEMFEPSAGSSEVTVGQEKKQQRQRAENDLQGAAQPQRAHEHDQREESPHGKIRRHRLLIRGRGDAPFGQNHQQNKRPPEKAVGKKSGRAESVSLFPFHDAGDNLCGPAVAKAHRQDHAVELIKTGVVQIEKDGCHTESEEPKRRRIGRGVANLHAGVVHAQEVTAALLTKPARACQY